MGYTQWDTCRYSNPELLALMKKSGCYSIAFGIESGNQDILDNIKKKTRLETIEYAITEANKAGIVTQGFLFLGYLARQKNQSGKLLILQKNNVG